MKTKEELKNDYESVKVELSEARTFRDKVMKNPFLFSEIEITLNIIDIKSLELELHKALSEWVSKAP